MYPRCIRKKAVKINNVSHDYFSTVKDVYRLRVDKNKQKLELLAAEMSTQENPIVCKTMSDITANAKVNKRFVKLNRRWYFESLAQERKLAASKQADEQVEVEREPE